MTGYTVHTGSTDAFANNYDQIFGSKKKTAKKKKTEKRKATKATAKKARSKKK